MTDDRWWLGVPLPDRPRPASVSPAERDHGDRRLRAWRSGAVVGGHPGPPATWSPESAGISARTLRALMPGPPEWLDVMTGAWRDYPAPLPGPAAGPDELLLTWVRPLVSWAQHRLSPRVAGSPAFLAPDDRHLLTMIKRVLVLELNAARVEGTLPGATPEERFRRFARRLADPGEALRMLAGYPVLARELVFHLRTWVTVRAELAQRLHDDRAELHRRFGTPAAGLPAVSDVRFGLGDTHRGGRAVAVVEFGDGSRIVHKPRSLAVESHFNDLLHRLGGYGPRHPLRPAEVLDRGTYGWAEFITAAPCRDRAELGRFFWRQGAHLAVLHLLRAYDMHAWNLIAAGEHPVCVDLEALFRDRRREPAGIAPGSAAHLLAESVLPVQMLPRRIDEPAPGRQPNFGVCGIAGGAEPGDRAVLWSTAYTGEGTDTVRTARLPQPVDPSANRPRIIGDPAPAPVDVDAVLDGFTETYRLLMANAGDLPLDAFADDEVRVVPRNTRFYTAVLDQMWHPDLLRDSFDREAYLSFLEPGEIRQLDRHDVPVFTARAGDGGLDVVRRRLADLSEADLERQVWFIRASLCTQIPVAPAPLPGSGAAGPDRAMAAARLIGDRLVRTALPDRADQTVEWLSLHRAGPGRWSVGATPLGLASGTCGIALFLAELGEMTGEARYRALAQDVVEGLVGDDRMPDEADLSVMGIGAWTDLGAVTHLLLRLARLWADPGLLGRTDPLISAMIPALSSPSVPPGLADGAAGAGVTAARVHAVRPGPATTTVIRLARERLAGTTFRRAGFAGGLLGGAYAAALMAETDGDTHLAEALVRAAVDRPADGVADVLAALAIADLPRMAAFRDTLRQRTAPSPAGDDSLARGSLGVAEIHRHRGDPRAAATAAAVASRVLAGDIRTGAPGHVWTPGLFDGAAGIGWGLLRSVDYRRVAGVLIPDGSPPIVNTPIPPIRQG